MINVRNWRNGKGRGPRDPPFRPPVDAEGGAGAYDELEEEEEYISMNFPARVGSGESVERRLWDGERRARGLREKENVT